MKRFSQAELCDKISELEGMLFEFDKNSQTKGYADLSNDLCDIRLLVSKIKTSCYLVKDAFERASLDFRSKGN